MPQLESLHLGSLPYPRGEPPSKTVNLPNLKYYSYRAPFLPSYHLCRSLSLPSETHFYGDIDVYPGRDQRDGINREDIVDFILTQFQAFGTKSKVKIMNVFTAVSIWLGDLTLEARRSLYTQTRDDHDFALRLGDDYYDALRQDDIIEALTRLEPPITSLSYLAPLPCYAWGLSVDSLPRMKDLKALTLPTTTFIRLHNLPHTIDETPPFPHLRELEITSEPAAQDLDTIIECIEKRYSAGYTLEKLCIGVTKGPEYWFLPGSHKRLCDLVGVLESQRHSAIYGDQYRWACYRREIGTTVANSTGY